MFYFAYGSNMNSDLMLERAVPFRNRSFALLKDFSLRFNKISVRYPGSGVANIVPKKGAIVEGILYDIDTEGLQNLNYYEGVPDEYYQAEVVLIVNSDKVEAITFIANNNRVDNNLQPSENYVNHLLKADGLLSESYLLNIKRYKTFDDI